MAYYAPARSRARPGFSLLFVVWVAVGAVVAYSHHYWENINTFKEVASAVLATLLWPLLLLGVSLHIR
jgi:hypothetical protein